MLQWNRSITLLTPLSVSFIAPQSVTELDVINNIDYVATNLSSYGYNIVVRINTHAISPTLCEI